MLDYDWGNLVTGDGESSQHSDQSSQIFNHYSQPFNENLINPNHNGFNFHNPQIQNTHFQPLYDPRTYGPSPSYPVPPPGLLSLEPVPSGSSGYMVMPKIEPAGIDYTSRIGLNLGGRTYFSSAENDFVNRLYRRSRTGEPGSVSAPRCQAEGCNADLTHAKHYHRRHKVCEFHSKAATVIAAGLTQRFCQQCSRFHLLTEFDNGKRSCRRRLADHNRRRRKTHQTNQDHSKSQLENAPNSSTENLARSSPPSSSVTILSGIDLIKLQALQCQQAHSSSQMGDLFLAT